MHVIGLDVSRTIAEIAYLENGHLQAGGRVELQHARLAAFAKRLRATDEVVLEATGNTAAIVSALKPHVARVIVANPLQVRLIGKRRSRPIRSTRPCLRNCMPAVSCRKSGFPMTRRKHFGAKSRAAPRLSAAACD